MARTPRNTQKSPSPDREPNDRNAKRRPQVRPESRLASRLYGLHTVSQAWLNPERQLKTVWVTEAASQDLATILSTSPEGVERPNPIVVDKDVLSSFVPAGAVHQGIVAEAAPLEPPVLEELLFALEHKPRSAVLMLDQVTDPHNVGAMMRSAAAFGIDAIIVQDRHAPIVTGTLAKAASGAVDVVPMIRVTNISRALSELKAIGFWSVGMAEEAPATIDATTPAAKTVIVLGAEGAGLRRLTRETCDQLVRLPTVAPIESLNVSNAAAIALFHITRQAAALAEPNG